MQISTNRLVKAMDENKGTELTDDERRELEELRAEKAKRQEAAKAAQERAELEHLRSEKAVAAKEQEEIRHEQAQRERGRKLMEPDDDLKMPLGQKITIVAVVGLAIIFILVNIFSH
jgi:hypothetical protein